MARGVSATCEIGNPRGRARLQDPVPPLACGQAARAACSGEIRGRNGSGAVAALLPDGRLHLQHGPIDIIAKAVGPAGAVRDAYARAAARFASVLVELVAELPELRRQDGAAKGGIARRMSAATRPFCPAFVTPMAAVAGAVAEEILMAVTGPEPGAAERAGITRAHVNNGGDIALWLAPGESLTCGLGMGEGADRVTVRHSDPFRGIATSGWRGRSFSLGIADAVTVLARTAAMADAAATLLANAVTLDHPAIERRPACALAPESDLGDRRVTVAVPRLSAADRARALTAGMLAARAYHARGLIEGAALFLQGERRITGALALDGRTGLG